MNVQISPLFIKLFYQRQNKLMVTTKAIKYLQKTLGVVSQSETIMNTLGYVLQVKKSYIFHNYGTPKFGPIIVQNILFIYAILMENVGKLN